MLCLEQVHDEIISRGMLGSDVVLGNALVDMYGKCGYLIKAQQVLEELPVRNVVSWSTLIAGYAREGQGHKALYCVERMQSEGFSADGITFSCILKACGNTWAIGKGKYIHEVIVSRNLLEKDAALGNALVDMYAKFGMLTKANQVLEQLSLRDIVSWNALITGYAQQGDGHAALACFLEMQNHGLPPDEVTFLSVLSACTHSGLLCEAQMVFKDMTRKYGVMPNLEHHTCMVVVSGLAGHFDEAISVIKVMPSSDHVEIWLALLGACRRWGHVKLGVLAFDQIIQIDNSCASAYVIVGNIFAASGMQEDAENAKAMRVKYGGSL